MPMSLPTDPYLPWVERRLDDLLPPGDRVPQPLHEAMRYSVLAPGKRLRPALTITACGAAGGDPLSALDAGCAIEMVHCFSLIHDDLPAIDNDDLRRGRPTCHKVFGEAIAILAGDSLFAMAFGVMGLSPAGLPGVLELSRVTGPGGLVGGEALDILSEKAAPDRQLLRKIHHEKTGVLFGACGAIGAMCAGATDADIHALRQYGEQLGLAFQIADDILNETSTAEQLGKAAGSDRELGKMTYPSLYGLDESRRMAEEAVQRATDMLTGLAGDTSALRDLAVYAIRRSK
jgi:geranylgeranyl diphosphate synthase type II